jgi:hypothetical protein
MKPNGYYICRISTANPIGLLTEQPDSNSTATYHIFTAQLLSVRTGQFWNGFLTEQISYYTEWNLSKVEPGQNLNLPLSENFSVLENKCKFKYKCLY